MITTKLLADVKATFERTGQDLELTYNEFKDQLTPKEVYNICINKAEVKDELPKEDLNGNRLNPFIHDEEPEEEDAVVVHEDDYIIVDGTIEETSEDPKPEPKPIYSTKPAMVISTKEDTLNYESIGFAIGFKNADADDLLAMANGNALRLVPALQWLYGQTDDEGIRNRIEELTLDVLFDK